VEDFSDSKPQQFDTTSSKKVNYFRKDIKKATRTDEDGNVAEFWQYKQLSIPKGEWVSNDVLVAVNEDLDEKTGENAEGVEVNADGLDDLAETTDTGLTALDELAEYVASLEERIEALENKEE
jgi:hypothetical protein